MITKKNVFPALPAGICLAGLLFCLWVLNTGGKELCLTSGCTLFQDLRLAGISLWHAGSVLFGLLLLFCLVRLTRVARALALAAVLADTILLGIMLFTAPCVNCLIVGTLIALACLSLCRSEDRSARPRLLAVWLVFLILDLGNALHGLAEPWSPTDEGQSSIQIYFSPSCSACQTLTAQAPHLENARWFPVPEDSRDIWVIHEMLRRMESGTPLAQAAEQARQAVPEGPAFEQMQEYRIGLLRPEMLLLQFRLWRNQAHVLAAGSNRLPFVEFLGLPSALVPSPSSDKDHQPPSPPHNTPEILNMPGLDMDIAGFCGGDDAPCTDPVPSQPQGNLHDLMDQSGLYQP